MIISQNVLEIVKFIALLVVTYFFMQLLTNKKKNISIVGTILVCCSSYIAWQGVSNAILLGEILLLSLYYFINSENIIKKVVSIVALILSIIICLVIQASSGINISELLAKNSEAELSKLFSYGYSMFLPFVDTGKNTVYSSFVSIFPLSLILAMVYVYKEEKHLKFLMPMIIVIALASILGMLKNIEGCAVMASLGCIYLYIYMIANIEENIFSMKTSIKIVLGLLVLYFLIPRPDVFMSKGYMYILAMLITLLYFLFINFADERYQKVLLIVLVIWSLMSFIPVFI